MKQTKYSPLELIAIAFILAILLWPVPVDSANGPLHEIANQIFNLIGLNPTSYFIVEKLSNLLLFVPVGFIAAKHTSTFQAVVISVAFSISAELVQKFIITARVFALDDIVANSLGALLGILVYRLLLNRAKSR